VAALAAAALVMSVVALTLATRDRAIPGVADVAPHAVASTGAPLWDVGKIKAMEGRMVAESFPREDPAVLWDPGRMQAMEGRVLAG
jgi:hypothetical protein